MLGPAGNIDIVSGQNGELDLGVVRKDKAKDPLPFDDITDLVVIVGMTGEKAFEKRLESRQGRGEGDEVPGLIPQCRPELFESGFEKGQKAFGLLRNGPFQGEKRNEFLVCRDGPAF